MNSEDHQHLIARVAMSDVEAFEQLYDDSYSRLYAVALHLLQQPDRADEALQDAFVKIWNNAGEYRQQRGSVVTWMASIVRYRCLDYLRGQNIRDERFQAVDDIEQLDSVVIEASLMEGQFDREQDQLNRCLQELEPSQRQVIYLSYLRGLSHREIVDRIGAPLGSVKSWIRRGLQRLKGCVEA